jgi:hypothetical protein
MLPVLLVLYAIYFLIVGINGNASSLISQVETEKQFIYWALVILIVMALWDTQTGEKIAKPFAFLIVLGFLLHNNNWKTIASNAKTAFPGL